MSQQHSTKVDIKHFKFAVKKKEKIDTINFNQEQVEKILHDCSIREMLNKYKLTAEFCVKYILTTDDYAASVEDSYHDIYDVLSYQKHLTLEDLYKAIDSIENSDSNSK